MTNALRKTSQATLAIPASHVILGHGDCLAKLRKLPDNSVDLVLTDPPFGTTGCAWDTVIDLDEMWRELYRVGTPECVFVFTAQHPFTTQLSSSNLKHHRYNLVWEKSNGTNPMDAKNKPMKVHEDILVFCRKKPRYNPQMVAGKPYKAPSGVRNGGEAGGLVGLTRTGKDNAGTRYPRSVLYFAQERGWHPTQKPVDLMAWLIRTYSNAGQTVLDLTMGSGTTGVAAVREGRNFIGFELDRDYMAIARRRIGAAQAGKPDPLPPGKAQRAQLAAAKKQTLRSGRGFGVGRRSGGKQA